MRSIALVLFMVFAVSLGLKAQTDTFKAIRDTSNITDTALTVKPVIDSLPIGIRMPDSLRHDQYIDTLLKKYAFNPFDFAGHGLKVNLRRVGHERPSRNIWVVFVILILLIYAGLINRLLGKDVYNVVMAFYLKSAFAKLSKEDNLLTSWAFIGLFLLFGFTVGLFLYQVAIYRDSSFSLDGFQLFLACSILVIVLFVLKILVLRIIGFIFDIHKLVRDYVSILYLTYFNIAFIFLPVVICFSLFPPPLMGYLLGFSLILTSVVVLIQYARSILNIISNFTFHKIYLFIYLCALEICPILIIIKALNL